MNVFSLLYCKAWFVTDVLLVVGSVVGALCGIIIIGIVLLVVGLLCFFVYKKGEEEIFYLCRTNLV